MASVGRASVASGVAERSSAPSAAVGDDRRRTITYQPALDGVRALAVATVLLFHAEVPGFGGGYLGVSVFFTLSGYLITTLLTVEMERDGRVALGAFYGRRARRLVPASVLVVLAVVVASWLTDWFDTVDSLRAHAIGSLLQVANWVFLAGDGSYQELLDQAAGTASPLEHYWSLAIEEQFYWIWPIAFVGVWRLGGSSAGRIRLVCGLTLVSAIAAPVIAIVWGADAAYWSTPARAAEILVGAAAALLLRNRELPARVAVLAPLSLVVLAVCVVTFPTVGGPAYSGALPLVGVVSVGLIVGLQATSATRDAIAAPPLVWLGTISYGVYLFHWPVFVVVDEERLGVGGPVLLATRLAITLAISQLSFSLFERPIRHRWSMEPRTTLVAAGGATAVAVAIAAIVVPGPRGAYWEADADDVAAAAITVDDEPLAVEPVEPVGSVATSVAPAAPPTEPEASPEPSDGPASTVAASDQAEPPPTTEPPLPAPSRPVRLLVAGDSTAEAMGAGVVSWAATNPDLAQAEVMALPGCGFVREGEYLLGGSWSEYQPGCARYFYEAVPDRAGEVAADVVVLLATSWDLLDRRWEGGEALTPVDYVDRVERDYAELTGALLANGVGEVVWIEMPVPNPDWAPELDLREEPARHAALRAGMERSLELYGDSVTIVELDEWFSEAGLDGDEALRPDGIHLTPDAATAVVDAWLGEQLLRAVLLG